MPTVTAIMQARLGSSRLPGKVLLAVNGKTFLEHSFERLKLAQSVNQCVIATTTKKGDDKIADFCKNKGWAYSRGSETDVLDRYYQTALLYPADIIVRLTSDCPLLDPSIIDQVVNIVKQDYPSVSYAANVLPPRHFPRGLDVEAFTFKALETAWKEAREESQREHVTPFINTQPDLFPQQALVNETDYSCHRWTLDTQEDHDLLYKLLDQQPEPTSWKNILQLVEANPEWAKINAKIEQKKI
jgi:spore coat polysaccharide biosynthesis protein SpsF